VKRLRNDDAAIVRRQVVSAVGRICPTSDELLPLLLAGLDDGDQQVQVLAAMRLGEMEARAKQAVSRLLEHLTSGKDVETRQEIIYALSKIAPQDDHVADAMISLLMDKDQTILRANAATALGSMQTRHAETVSALLSAFASEDERSRKETHELRRATLVALGKKGTSAQKAIPLLTTVVSNHRLEPDLRAAAAASLGQIGVRSKEVLAVLKAAENDDQSLVSQAAGKALEQLK
jgi:hypothetical protein